MAGLKSEKDIRAILGRKLSRGFAEHLAGVREDWPCAISLGHPGKQEILNGFDKILALTRTLRTWEAQLDVQTEYVMREAGGPKRLPARIIVPSIDVAAELAAPHGIEPWTAAIERTRRRLGMLQRLFSNLDAQTLARVLRAEDASDDLEFELVLSAGAWFCTHDANGLTSREVPLPGIDGKWLHNARRQSILCTLAGKGSLGLVRMPSSLAFSYLDPDYLAQGHRRYDSWVAGDVQSIAYSPLLVIIVENKETYLQFPPVTGGICIFGSGKAAMALIGQLGWVTGAPQVIYWGDLDADGFEILDAYRARELSRKSILMDMAALERYGRYGTNLEKDHRTRIVREHKDLANLTREEREAYDLITSSDYQGHRRIEQERIPLADALEALAECMRT